MAVWMDPSPFLALPNAAAGRCSCAQEGRQGRGSSRGGRGRGLSERCPAPHGHQRQVGGGVHREVQQLKLEGEDGEDVEWNGMRWLGKVRSEPSVFIHQLIAISGVMKRVIGCDVV